MQNHELSHIQNHGIPLTGRRSGHDNDRQQDDLTNLVMLNPPIALFEEEDRQAY